MRRIEHHTAAKPKEVRSVRPTAGESVQGSADGYLSDQFAQLMDKIAESLAEVQAPKEIKQNQADSPASLSYLAILMPPQQQTKVVEQGVQVDEDRSSDEAIHEEEEGQSETQDHAASSMITEEQNREQSNQSESIEVIEDEDSLEDFIAEESNLSEDELAEVIVAQEDVVQSGVSKVVDVIEAQLRGEIEVAVKTADQTVVQQVTTEDADEQAENGEQVEVPAQELNQVEPEAVSEQSATGNKDVEVVAVDQKTEYAPVSEHHVRSAQKAVSHAEIQQADTQSEAEATATSAVGADTQSTKQNTAELKAAALIETTRLHTQAARLDTVAPVVLSGTNILKDMMEMGTRNSAKQASSILNTAMTNSAHSSASSMTSPAGVSAKAPQAEAKMLTRSNVLRTMEKVESALKEVARSKDGKTISLRLDPPSLGSLKVDVTIRDGQLHARLVAESAQVNNLLRERTPELQAMLRRLGLNVDKVSVSVSADASQFSVSDQGSGQSQTFKNSSREQGNRGSQGTMAGSAEQGNALRSQTTLDHWVA